MKMIKWILLSLAVLGLIMILGICVMLVFGGYGDERTRLHGSQRPNRIDE